MVHVFNLSTQKAEADRALNLRPALSPKLVGQEHMERPYLKKQLTKPTRQSVLAPAPTFSFQTDKLFFCNNPLSHLESLPN